jgi:hypothetical protein
MGRYYRRARYLNHQMNDQSSVMGNGTGQGGYKAQASLSTAPRGLMLLIAVRASLGRLAVGSVGGAASQAVQPACPHPHWGVVRAARAKRRALRAVKAGPVPSHCLSFGKIMFRVLLSSSQCRQFPCHLLEHFAPAVPLPEDPQ